MNRTGWRRGVHVAWDRLVVFAFFVAVVGIISAAAVAIWTDLIAR